MKTLSVILVTLALVVSGIACRSGAAVEIVREKIKTGALVVDVRSPAEFAAGAYAGAVNIPIEQVQQRLAEFGDVKHPVVVYCRSGHRSRLAKAILEKNGYSDVTDGGGLTGMPGH
jgi:phage shock protein E